MTPIELLQNTKRIALVGASPKHERDSYRVMEFLLERGYQVIPINPGQAGKEILGQTVYASLADAPAPFDMVDIFRNSDAAFGVVEEAIALSEDKGIRTIWMQLGVINEDAAALARAADLKIVMDRCPKIELERAPR